MSIRFNHSTNTMTSTDSATIIIEGGTTSLPRPLRLSASSLIVPNNQLPLGESGAIVFDISSKTMKYHDGFQWVELLSKDEINAQILTQIDEINNTLATKVSDVSYSSSSVPSASISGTTLNIVFPSSGGSTTDIPGLFTSSLPGSIMYYSLTSGQSVSSIREQMSGVTGGQTGRSGTSAAPYVTKTGWCFADGLYWTWNGESGTITKQIPNLNQNAYIKGITTTGVTKTDAVVSASGTIGNTTISEPLHFHGVGNFRGLSGNGGDDANFIVGKSFSDGNVYTGAIISGDKQTYWTGTVNGSDSRTAISTTYGIYPNGNTTTHNHDITSIDVAHFNAAVLYNIAEPSTALNQALGDSRYVLKAGDVMTGSLSIANNATIRSNDTNVVFYFRNNSNAERAVIYHSSTTNTLRFRSTGGTEVAINSSGNVSAPSITSLGNTTTNSLTVNGNSALVNSKNIVRSVNNTNADSSGNVNISTTSGSLGANGWWRDSNTGLIMQWGYMVSINADVYIPFPMQFPNVCYSVTLGQIFNSHDDQRKTARILTKATTAGFSMYIGENETGCYWQAIGR